MNDQPRENDVTPPTREDIARRTILAIARYVGALISGESIRATHVMIEYTPDGPLTTSRDGTVVNGVFYSDPPESEE